MSLDVYLNAAEAVDQPKGSGIFIRWNGENREISRAAWDELNPGIEPVAVLRDDEPSTCVYTANITHNLNKMAGEAGIYEALWRPDEIGLTHARMLIEPLTAGLGRLKSDPERYRKHNPSNGWGNYELLVSFVERYIEACKEHQDATVYACR